MKPKKSTAKGGLAKLLIVTNTARFFLSHRLHLGVGAKARGYEVHVLSPIGEEVKDITDKGFAHHTVNFGRSSMNPFRELGALLKLFKEIKKIRPSVIHLFTIKPVLYGTLVARLLNIDCIVVTMTGLGYLFHKPGLKGQFFRFCLAVAYRILFNSSRVAVIFQNRDDQKLFIEKKWIRREQAQVIPGTGVDLNVFAPSNQKSEVLSIVFPARFLIDKGIRELIAAADQLEQKKLKFELWLCGDTDPGNPSSIQHVEYNEIASRPYVKKIGYEPNMPAVLKAAHICCLPTYHEGLPLALIEAAACGLPIVTTNIPGCREVVADGQNGFLVPPRESNVLAMSLEKLLRSEILRHKMATDSRLRAQTLFAKEIVVEQNLAVYAADIEKTYDLKSKV